MKVEDSVYLKHILNAMSIIEEYSEGLSYKKFLKNRLVQDGVIRQIEIIGEATKKLSLETKNIIPDIPWKILQE